MYVKLMIMVSFKLSHFEEFVRMLLIYLTDSLDRVANIDE